MFFLTATCTLPTAVGSRKSKEQGWMEVKERHFIFDSNLVPNGLALDETRNKLYCAGTDLAGYGVIGVITLSDLSITFIFQRTDYRPFGLDIFEEHVYWTDLGKKALLRINKSSGTGMEVIISGLNKPKGLKILQRGQERLGRNSTQGEGIRKFRTCLFCCFRFAKLTEFSYASICPVSDYDNPFRARWQGLMRLLQVVLVFIRMAVASTYV